MTFIDQSTVLFASSLKEQGNMSFLRGDVQETIQNRCAFLQSLSIDPHHVFMISLPHKNDVIIAEKNDCGNALQQDIHVPSYDAAITREAGLFLFMITGDCLPIGLFDPVTNSVGLIHGSWKSLDEGIIENTITKMTTTFGVSATNIIAQFGPSIGPCCYQHMDQVLQKRNWGKYITTASDGTYTIDIWGFAKKTLCDSGIPQKNVVATPECTYHSGKYFSHRRYKKEKEQLDARFATVIGRFM